jgi:hypothetical protein
MNPSNNRIGLEDDFKAILTKLCDGNIGALNVLINLTKEEPAIDPDSALGAFGAILSLDSLGIYGSHIWILFKYRCDQSLVKLVALFRAHQLGFLNSDTIVLASQNPDTPVELDTDALLKRVQERLPAFGQPVGSHPA